MQLQAVRKELGCKHCGASGEVVTHSYEGDGYGGDFTGMTACSYCKGRKQLQVMLLVSDAVCGAHGSWSEGMLECQNGTMQNTREYYKYGRNFFGQETRQKIAIGQEREPCQFCFATGKKHYIAKKNICSNCRGRGEITESRWEKGFLGDEVRREYKSTCPNCQGKRFSWIIDYELRSSQIYESNL